MSHVQQVHEPRKPEGSSHAHSTVSCFNDGTALTWYTVHSLQLHPAHKFIFDVVYLTLTDGK